MNETKKPYQSEKDLVYVTGKSTYLHDDKVETGKLLRVTYISGMFENLATTEYVQLGYFNGHAYIPLHKDKPAVASDPINWNGDIWLREEQFIYAYFADVANGEKMKLQVAGHWE